MPCRRRAIPSPWSPAPTLSPRPSFTGLAVLAWLVSTASTAIALPTPNVFIAAGTTYTSNQSWGPSGSVPGTVYLVQGPLNITNNATLTIPPGTSVLLDPSATIVVGSSGAGKLVAGGSGAPVTFDRTGSSVTVGIDFTPAGMNGSTLTKCLLGTLGGGNGFPVRCQGGAAQPPVFSQCTFSRSPGNAILLTDASPALSSDSFSGNALTDVICAGTSAPVVNDCVFTSAHEGIGVTGSGVPSLQNDTFNGGFPYVLSVPAASLRQNAFTIAGGSRGVLVTPTGSSETHVSVSATWPSLPAGQYYQLAGDVIIRGGATVTLPADCQVSGQGGVWIYCGDPVNPANGGRLIATGTEGQHVRFVRAPFSAPWTGGVVVSGPSSSLQLTYAEVTAGPQLRVTGPHVVPNDVTLAKCILGDPAAAGFAIVADGNATLTVTESSIRGNASGAISATAGCSVSAAFNWWGHASGPYDPSPGNPSTNAGGQGAYVTDYVTYAPFFIQPPCLSPRTITASAGTGGSISPGGPTLVACGSSQSFTIAPMTGYAVADVLVDGASVGPVAGYTFPGSGIQVDHTIAASFAQVNPVHAQSPGACITSSDSCVQVPVVFDYAGTAPVRLFSVTLALGGSLELCGGVSGVHEGTFLSGAGATQMYVVDLGGGRYSVDCTILGLPCGATGAGTLFTLDVTSAAPAGVGTVTIESVTVRDCANADIVASIGSAASVGIDALPLTGVNDLAAAQVKTGNGTAGLTGIALTFTAPANAATVEVYRAPYGHYPEYDDAGGASPAVPSYPPPAPWTLTSVSASGDVDHPASRDFWYHVLFFKDACGQVSVVSNMTSGALDYHLGDVSNGITAGTGNDVVATEDLSALGAHYGAAAVTGSGFEYLDVGPTTDYSVNARPTTDDVVNFEDLAMFAINYGQVSGPAARSRPAPSAPGVVEQVSVAAPGLVAAGESFDAVIQLGGGGRLQMLSVALGWDGAVAEPVGADAAGWLAAQGGVAFSPRPGTVDAALLGVRSPGFTGTGDLAVVHFHARAAGAPALRVTTVLGRSSSNRPVPVEMNTLSVPKAPARTALAPITPTPSTGTARLSYTLARGGHVTLALHAVDGRRVRVLADGEREPGDHDVTWDGRDAGGHLAAPGVYYVRFEAPGATLTRRLVFVR